MRIQTFIQCVKIALDADSPERPIGIMVHSQPGMAKTSVLGQIAKDRSAYLLPIHLAQYDAVDIKSLPTIKDTPKGPRTIWSIPDLIATVWELFDQGWKEVILLFDDLPMAVPAVTSAAMQLLGEKRIGQYTLEGLNVHMMAAGNFTGDRGGANVLLSPVANRMVHFRLEPNLDDFVSNAVAKSFHPLVIAFVRMRAELLYTFNPGGNSENKFPVYAANGEYAFATYRSLEIVSRLLYELDEAAFEGESAQEGALTYNLVQAAVGKAWAIEFAAFARSFGDLPEKEQVLKNPTKTKIPSAASALYALSGALVAWTSKPEDFDAIMIYTQRLPKEFQVLVMRDLTSKLPAFVTCKATEQWMLQHGESLI